MIGRLRKLFERDYSPEALGLTVRIEDLPPRKAPSPSAPLVVSRVETGDIRGAIALIKAARQERRLVGQGASEAAVLSELALHPVLRSYNCGDGDGAADAAVAFVDHGTAHPDDPYAISLAAHALAMAGYAFRGFDWAKNVSQEGWTQLARYGQGAQEVLDKARPHCADNWLFRRTAWQVAFVQQVDRPTLDARFHETAADDPYDIGLWQSRMNQLLPRWFGSPEDLEGCAQDAASMTRAGWGDAGYAMAHATSAQFDDLVDTPVDAERLMAAFRDWHERFPCGEVATYWAVCAYQLDQDEQFCRIIENASVLYEDLSPLPWTLTKSYARLRPFSTAP